MKNESWVQTLKDYVMLTVGTLLIAIGVYFFKFPNHFSTGGVSGISIVLAHYAPNLSAGAFVFIINMALLALGFAVFGRSFGVRARPIPAWSCPALRGGWNTLCPWMRP